MLNPILFTERVVQDFLRYQLTAYPFADKSLYGQLRTLLNLEETRRSPLLKGPFVSLSRTFEEGISIAAAVKEGWLHPHLPQVIPKTHTHLYGHQEHAIRAIAGGRTTLVSTGTGSGKTECFLYPIISRCLRLRDENAPPGISAVIVYPMNALADDQMERLREILAGTGVRFGIYTGSLKDHTHDAKGHRLDPGSSREDYVQRLAQEREKPEGRDRVVIHPAEENISREEMRDPALRPRLLLTNVKQLELLLTRQRDIEMFDGATLDFLVFDEAHTFRGTMGAETACLIRRLRSYCGRSPRETVCVGTSATIVDPNDKGSSAAGRAFASRFFGVDPDDVTLVGERYQSDVWASAEERKVPPALNGNPADHLAAILSAVEKDEVEAGTSVAFILKIALGLRLPEKGWRLHLYEALGHNELLFQLVELLRGARALDTLSAALAEKIGRTVTDEEVLLWLALGAASRKDERPLVRPVIHTFVRGMGGAVVTFPQTQPRLYLAADTVEETKDLGAKLKPLPVLSCTTCGQHYFEHWVKDFTFTGSAPTGGQAAENDSHYWESCDEEHGGRRAVLLDRLVAQDDDDDSQPAKTAEVWFCRVCGCLHSHAEPICKSCGRTSQALRIFTAQTRAEGDGRLGSCLCCGARGKLVFGRHREPARPVRAVTVSDVHVLAQNMLQHAERKRLLVFADNRQDAAFQAGWMQDHSRRYRLRALIHERLKLGEVSLGDLVAWLDERLDKDNALSNAIAPEVWRAHRKAGAAAEHIKARKFFLRAQVLRELTIGLRQRIGLESWGRLAVRYAGLKEDAPFFQKWSAVAGLPAHELLRGVELLLDRERRNSHLLLDREGHIFTRFWREGMREIQLGFLPLLPDVPVGLVLRRNASHNENRVRQWLGKGISIVRRAAEKWNVPESQRVEFVEELWRFLTKEARVLVETRLLNSKNEALPACAGTHQIDGDVLILAASEKRGVYRCKTCRQTVNQAPPLLRCLAWNCKGEMQWEDERQDNYDLQVLDGEFTMMRPREHSAQVPQAERTSAEQFFKGGGEAVNCLVCTPTLELGVDIGQLDSVLMRNVPPLPANYFQRAGRAGRRHRMAVNLTYARPASHDRAFFETPEKLLNGVVLPPRFNLSNPVLIARHAHAALLTTLFSMATRDDGEDVERVLKETFPTQIAPFFFGADGILAAAPANVGKFSALVEQHRHALLAALRAAFNQGWPVEDATVVSDAELEKILVSAADNLQAIIQTIWIRLQWHLRQLDRMRAEEQKQGALSDEETAFRERCRRYVNKLKGQGRRARGTAEGFDDTNIYAILAAEGWLPGYGLDTGSVIGSAIKSISSMSRDDFDLPRPSGMAVREYVPGNLVYANGERYTPRLFHLPPVEPVRFAVDLQSQAVREVEQAGGALGATSILAMPICDVEMPHLSHISDEEEFRFQMPVMIAGMEQSRHDGGKAWKWGSTVVLHRQNVHLRLVNLGPQDRIAQGTLGYPVCLVTGQSRSPYSSQEELRNFSDSQLERCGKRPEMALGFYADVVAQCSKLQDMPDQTAAYSIGEIIRLAGSRELDMEPDDLQLLVIPHPNEDKVDLLVYDPMPGGSGLLKQILEAWPRIVTTGRIIADTCPSNCASSCPDCLQRFRNAFYHRFLDRHRAIAFLDSAGSEVCFTHEIPPILPTMKSSDAELPVNQAEMLLFNIIKKAGLPEPQCQKSIAIPKPFVATTPDFFYEDPKEVTDGICIYLDGLSQHIHGNAATKQKDEAIRNYLREKNYAVLSIPASHLNAPEQMSAHLYNLARKLVGKTQAEAIRESKQWRAEQNVE